MEPKKPALRPWQHAASGAIAGFVARMVVAPLDVVKIRLQLQTTMGKDAKYRGIAQAVKTIVREESIWALWKGNASAQLLYLSYGGVQFLTYDRALQILATNGAPDRVGPLCAGAIAGVAATAATYPLDLLRTRFAVQGNERVLQSLRHAVQATVAHEGAGALYRGLWPSLLQIVPYMGVMFAVYDAARRALGGVAREHPALAAGAAGATAGAVSKAAVMPFDVVRKRMQVQGPQRQRWVVTTRALPDRARFARVCAQIVREEGVRALWRGTAPALLKAVPNSAVTFAVVEVCRQFFAAANAR